MKMYYISSGFLVQTESFAQESTAALPDTSVLNVFCKTYVISSVSHPGTSLTPGFPVYFPVIKHPPHFPGPIFIPSPYQYGSARDGVNGTVITPQARGLTAPFHYRHNGRKLHSPVKNLSLTVEER